MSYPLTQIGGRNFNHEPSSEVEHEYDRLRAAARKEMDRRRDLSSQSQEAYQSGDGGRAKKLSTQAKGHAEEADEFNERASNLIFRENNAPDRVASDSIDLHGQYVEEAEKILNIRLQQERSQGSTHLHVIVGRGNHSANHVQKIKPAVEQICRQMGLAYQTESNEGRIYVDLTGNQNMPQHPPQPGQGYHRPQGGQQQQQQYHEPQAGAGYQRPPLQQQQQLDDKDTGFCNCLASCTVM